MPSQNMLPKGHRRRSVRPEYVATRGIDPAEAPAQPPPDLNQHLDADSAPDALRTFPAHPAAAGMRLDLYLAQALPDLSRARVQLLIASGQVRVNNLPAKAKAKLKGGEIIAITGQPNPEPLNATPEDIPLDLLYEDKYLAVVNKPAGMLVHAGAGHAPLPGEPDPRSRGTLVNALLFHLAKLSSVGGDLRPGIVHRLDKQTSGAIVVAKDDLTHRRLGEMFAARQVQKTYIALAHGHLDKDSTTVSLPIARDLVRRTRMTTRRALGTSAGRSAVSHFHVRNPATDRLVTPYGPFTLVEVTIETGRTHQIRVHLQSLGHPVVGDTLYGAAGTLRRKDAPEQTLTLSRNYLHAAELSFKHPRTSVQLTLKAALPAELTDFLVRLKGSGPA